MFSTPNPDRRVVSLGLVDNTVSKKYLLEATPDMPVQMKALAQPYISNKNEIVDGIFLTHAHIGHYTGLMYLGKEAVAAKNVKVYVMPRMKHFLETNGPWSQLVFDQNISLTLVHNEENIRLTPSLEVQVFLVPHRDEYSETVGYRIIGPHKKALFIPDINKWSIWEKNILEEIKKVDYAFLDATFYSGAEIDHRDISQIPHPTVIESMARFDSLDIEHKSKIIFIHFNHTNPILDPRTKEAKEVLHRGFNIAQIHSVYAL